MIKRPALVRSPRGRQSSSTRSVPAPIGGWNARDSEAQMPETDATVLENWIPGTSSVDLRLGASSFVTGFVAAPKSLLAYSSPTVDKLFAANSSGIYDVSAAGAVGAAAIACTDGRFQYVNMTTSGGSFLLAVNGVDTMKKFDGTTWSSVSAAITGITTDQFVAVALFKRRAWFVQKNSLSAWYLGIDSIAGAATEFPLGTVFKRGGHLVAMTSWTVDGGDGSDDYCVFITSKGEVAVYKGTDPASASTFALVGVYFLGEPLGKNCFIRYGGDVLALTQTGIFPLSKALLSATIKRDSAISDKIQKAFSDAAALYGNLDGWGGIVLPKENLLLVNVPTTHTSQQFVMNTITGAWTLFTGWDATCFETFAGNPYFATSTLVAQAFSGYSDFGSNILAKARQAFSYFGMRAVEKHFKLVRPMLRIDKAVNIQLGINVDFEDLDPVGSSLFTPDPSAVWDTSKWNQSRWSPEYSIKRQWHTIAAKTGYCAALRLRIASNAAKVGWSSTDYLFERGGVL